MRPRTPIRARRCSLPGSAIPETDTSRNEGNPIRQQLVESLLLALAGAALGLIVASWTGALLLSVLPGDPASSTLSADPDMRVALFALALALVMALVFGIGPAIAATRAGMVAAFKDDAGSVAGGGRQARVRRGLVVAQVALSMLLLAGGPVCPEPLEPANGRSHAPLGRDPAGVMAHGGTM